MATTVTIERSAATPEAIARVQQLLDETALRDANWNGVEFRLVRGDFTSVDTENEYNGAALLSSVHRAIDGR